MEKTGLQLFSRYAYPCLEEKKHKISAEDYQRFVQHIRDWEDPEIDLLERCFPNAVNEYRKSCKESQIEANFSIISVINHWRHHHNRDGDCAVRMLVVFGFEGKIKTEFGMRETIKTGLDRPVINLFQIPLEICDLVAVHRMVVIEKALL